MVAVPEQLAGDFEQAYQAYYPMLLRRSRRWLPAGEVEDAVQETFLRAWSHHRGADPGAAWLLTVLRNIAIDRSRKKTAEPVADLTAYERPRGETSLDDDVIRLDERRTVRTAIANLTEGQREALRLREWEGMSQEQIANALGTTVPSVESLLVRGRRSLRRMLDHAMGVAVWPVAVAWKKLRGLPPGAHAAAASPLSQAGMGWT
ncbi:MAG: sigma-70 family RNA polymerase sigma factor, partial [Actinomycetota bacterium]|nr:sigma-70 family RNA polymerase sigma factor [Actinomycetota bacterium]